MAAAASYLTSSQPSESLVRKYAELVRRVVKKMASGFPSHVDMEDLIGDGMVGLLEAMKRFDPSKGYQLQTFAVSRIRGSILDALRGQDWASRGARRRVRELRGAEERLFQTLGRAPTIREVALATGRSPGEVHRRRQESDSLQLVSIDDPRSSRQASQDSLANFLEDQSIRVEDEVCRSETRRRLLRGIKTLPQREQLILSLYYFGEVNVREIGSRLGVSEARISQIHGRCLRRLRAYLDAESQQQVS